ncbi:MAG TPA: hypothetical protein VIC35_14790 [Acidimicrobiia bacterium]|jgi:hypothetical protein
MPEGLSAPEVGEKIGEHRHRADHETRDRAITIVEAVLLAIVAFVAAYSGYASAKWSTDSRLELSRASTARTEAANENLEALSTRNFDSSTFEAWYTAFVAKNEQAMTIAARRFRPLFRVAFDAWQRTNPEENPSAPPGPTYMPEYKLPQQARANALNAKADHLYDAGSTSGTHADDYLRVTVYLATVLFLVAISGHFPIRGVRIGLVGVGIVVLVLALATLATLPGPPSA